MIVSPPIGELLEKVDCRYTLVVAVSRRARQLEVGAQPLVAASPLAKPVSVAVEEFNRGLIVASRPHDDSVEG